MFRVVLNSVVRFGGRWTGSIPRPANLGGSVQLYRQTETTIGGLEGWRGLVEGVEGWKGIDAMGGHVLNISTFKRKKIKIRKDRARTVRRKIRRKSAKKRKPFGL